MNCNYYSKHDSNDACKCKTDAVAQSLDEMAFERGIWTAAIDNDLIRLKSFIDKGQQNAADNNQYTALHYASRIGHYDACQMLLEAGADPNAYTKSGRVTPLMRAAMMGHEKIVQLLLRHRAIIQMCDSDGNTARDRAIRHGHLAIAQLLKESDQN